MAAFELLVQLVYSINRHVARTMLVAVPRGLRSRYARYRIRELLAFHTALAGARAGSDTPPTPALRYLDAQIASWVAFLIDSERQR